MIAKRSRAMGLFSPENRTKNERNKRIYAIYELAFTIADFCAALAFMVGSIMFYFEAWQTIATTFFLVGSIRVLRELRYAHIGDVDDLADRFSI
jgi:hypothetical protein